MARQVVEAADLERGVTWLTQFHLPQEIGSGVCLELETQVYCKQNRGIGHRLRIKSSAGL